jgi:hypothetical protein
LFFCEETRKVKKDNTFSFGGHRFEAPATLHDKEVNIRFDRSRRDFPRDRLVVYYKAQRMGEAKLLDAVANGILRNKTLQGAFA